MAAHWGNSKAALTVAWMVGLKVGCSVDNWVCCSDVMMAGWWAEHLAAKWVVEMGVLSADHWVDSTAD
jgi:hypothetical protein